jgi:thiamine biosynthesis protein ThiS
MKIRINGQDRDVEDGMTVKGLLVALDIKPQGIAIDINKEIVPKSRLEETLIKEDDVIEIVRMTGGG